MAFFNSVQRFVGLAVLFASLAWAGPAVAQNTGGVFGPKVKEGAASAQYRFAYVPGEGAAPDRFAHRILGSKSLDSRKSITLALQGNDRGGPEGLEFSFLQAQLNWEVSPEDAEFWSTGFRFDARLADGDAPEQIGVNWTNQFELSDRLSARAILLSTVQFGDRAADGVLLSSRGQLAYDLGGGTSIALQSFNSLGSTEDFGTGGRSQQLGPVLTGNLGDGWSWTAGNLFGLNEATPDNDVRIWLGRSF